MAQQDYFSGAGSKYGQLAGSLLSSGRRRKKKDIIKLLALSAISEALGQKGAQLKNDLANELVGVKDNYTDIFTNNKELYELKSKSRDRWQSYLSNPEEYLDSRARDMFNSDRNLRDELGFNPYGAVNQETMDPASYVAAKKVYDAFYTQAETEIKQEGKNPGVNIPTFSKFNAPAVLEYKAAYRAVQDDPTRKGVIRSTWNNLFGEDRDGNKRFGMIEKAELEVALENARNKREERQKVVTDSVTFKQQEENTIQETAEANTQANNTVEEIVAKYPGTEIPLDFDFQTNADALKAGKESFSEKVNGSDYVVIEEDISKSIEYGIRIPGYSDLNLLLTEDRPALVVTAVLVNAALAEGKNPWDDDVLNSAQRRIWSIATYQDLNARQASDMNLKKNIREMNKLVSVDYTKVDNLYENDVTNASTVAAIEALLEEQTYAYQKEIYNNYISESSEQALIKHVIEGALLIQLRNPGIGFGDAMRKAIPIQMNGFYKVRKSPLSDWNPKNWGDDETHKHEYVNVEAIRLMSKNIETEQEAKLATYYMNNHKYIQNMANPDDITQSLTPTRVGQSFVEGEWEFTVKDIAKKDLTDSAGQLLSDDKQPTQLIWTYEFIGG